MNQFQSQPINQRIDYRQLRELVSIEQVLEFINWQPSATKGPQLRGPCPVHQSTNPHSRSFSVNLEKNAYRCFSCDSQGNQLDLAAAIFGLDLHAAAIELCHRLQLNPPSTS